MRLKDAMAIHAAATRKAGRMLTDEAINRSTRVQRAQRIKAEAFEQIGKALAGKT